MGWFKSHHYPDYWNRYTAQFKTGQNPDLDQKRFVVFDTETTGLNPKTDRILSIGTVAVQQQRIRIKDQLEVYLEASQFNADTVKIHGLLKAGKLKKITEEQAIIQFLDHVKDAVLVAHHAAFDIAMINAALRRMQLPKLKNKVLDTGQLFLKTQTDPEQHHFSLDNLCEHYKLPKHDRHTASGDAYLTALIFLKLWAKLQPSTLSDLMRPHRRIGLL